MGRPRKQRNGLPAYCYRDRKNGAYYMLVPAPGGKRTRRTYGDDLHRMLDDWARSWGASQRLGDTVGAALDLYVAKLATRRHKGEIEASTEQDYRKHIATVRQVFGKVRLQDVDGPMLENWKEIRGDISPTQFNHERTVLMGAFKVAIAKGMIDRNPVRHLETKKLAPREIYVQTADAELVLKHANRAVQAAAMLAVSTGMRQGDILRLRRSAFSEAGLTYLPNKTKKSKKVPLELPWSPGIRLACELAARKVVSLDGYWLTRRDGKPYSSSGFRSMWNRALVKARKEREDLPRFTFHDLRGKAGSDAANHALLGIDSKTFNKHYNRKPQKVTPAR